ncbi:protein cpsf-4 [Stylonychia lemnae]|uniref:Protein cpsf-4 n=1 Tax=Stylonychia lemnae TaxID=5949 RepID=A0A078A712_STYLE|nr:protein cpsf-4 [Stylonychia lemnae]|eukprot:CDW77342.1 protein cpsf-4 [Stylonychia lemnae]
MNEQQLTRNQIQAILESQTRKVDESKRKRTVCVHWLSNQCKKDERCEFLHVFQEDKIPPCRYYLQEGDCSKGDKCVFRHVNAQEKRTEDCPYYERGFCRLGIFCSLNHYQKKICQNYMYGFCPKGPDCDLEHIKSVIADNETTLKILANFPDNENWFDKNALSQSHQQQQQQPWQKAMVKVRCHRCGSVGHKSTYCQEEQITPEQLNQILAEDEQYNMQNRAVLCFKCKRYGHYANVCPTRSQNNQAVDAIGQLFPNLNFDTGTTSTANIGAATTNIFGIQGTNDQAPSGYADQNISQLDHQNEAMNSAGGDPNDITQNLRNIQRMLDGQGGVGAGSSQDNQMVRVTSVSLQELPLTFEQINMAINNCAMVIQQEGFMSMQ